MDTELNYFYSEEIFALPETGCDFHWYTKNRSCLHQHMDYYEFSLITKGKIQYRVTGSVTNDKEVLTQVKRGDLLFCRPGDVHVFSQGEAEENVQINISFTEPVLQAICALLSPDMNAFLQNHLYAISSISVEDSNRLITLVHETILQSKSKEDHAAAIRYWVITALFCLYRQSQHICLSPTIPPWFSALLEQMKDPQYFEGRLTELPLYCQHSPTTISKYFRLALDTTPNAYYLHIRFRYACRLLSNTDFGILKIAQMIGFDSLSHFNHAFRKRYGMTPKEFRNRGKQVVN